MTIEERILCGWRRHKICTQRQQYLIHEIKEMIKERLSNRDKKHVSGILPINQSRGFLTDRICSLQYIFKIKCIYGIFLKYTGLSNNVRV